jgi:hypothetical protein
MTIGRAAGWVVLSLYGAMAVLGLFHLLVG